jgi:hypothetical protein
MQIWIGWRKLKKKANNKVTKVNNFGLSDSRLQTRINARVNFIAITMLGKVGRLA